MSLALAFWNEESPFSKSFHWNPYWMWVASHQPRGPRHEVGNKAIVLCTYVVTFSSFNHFLVFTWVGSERIVFMQIQCWWRSFASNIEDRGFDLILCASLNVFCTLTCSSPESYWREVLAWDDSVPYTNGKSVQRERCPYLCYKLTGHAIALHTHTPHTQRCHFPSGT